MMFVDTSNGGVGVDLSYLTVSLRDSSANLTIANHSSYWKSALLYFLILISA